MSREGALLVMLAAAVVLIGLMALGWWRRARRDRGLAAPIGDIPAGAKTLAVVPVLYVATTARGAALERLVVRGLGFRARGTVVVTDAGVALDLVGSDPVFVPLAQLDDADQATVTIDRVVERDGLTRMGWRLQDGTEVDSYLRPVEVSARALAAAIHTILPEPTPTPGADV